MFEQHTGSGLTADEPPNRAGVSVELLERMGLLSERLTANLLSPYGLTPPQARVLQAMHRHGPDLPLHDIAAVTAFPLGALTSIMDRLLLRGLVEQRAGFGQRMTISITPEGQQIVVSVDQDRARSLARLLDGFPEEELAAIARLAARMEHEVAATTPHPTEPAKARLGPLLRLIK